ncbi:DUF3124 domain-containing protein [bacterium]|nr:DUF3124 domain-containing protein [bacterium]
MTYPILSHGKGLILGAIFLVLTLALYAGLQVQADQSATAHPTSSKENDEAHGELIYVPIYSSIYYENGKRTLELAATLAIHNIDPDHSITVTRADYFNSEGKLIKKYLEKPIILGPLQTTNIIINRTDTTGGTGANFLVDWNSKGLVASPLIEAVMANASSNLGIAFTSTGKVVRSIKTN